MWKVSREVRKGERMEWWGKVWEKGRGRKEKKSEWGKKGMWENYEMKMIKRE